MSDEAPPAAGEFRRVLESRVEAIGVLADEFSAWAQQEGVSPRDVSHVNLMLDELITNVITYGYAKTPGEVVVEASLVPGELRIVVTDHAFAHNPLGAKEPDLDTPIEERTIGGLGVHFVKMLADRVDYERVDDRGRGANRLRIVKRLA